MRTLEKPLRAFAVWWSGLPALPAHYAAPSAAHARAHSARILEEYWSRPFGRAVRELRVLREPRLDALAAARECVSTIPPEDAARVLTAGAAS